MLVNVGFQDLLDQILSALPGILWFLVWGAALAVSLSLLYRFLLGKRPDLSADQKLSRQLILLLSIGIALVLLTLALPVSEGMRNQILSLIGIVLSGLIAFSSTTIVGNLMAGFMMRFTRPFKVGDFVKVQNFFGRVTELGLLDTEFQTEHRELISFPNSYLISNPVVVTQGSGAIVSTELSLGFDVHHETIEPLLIKAAEKTGLEDAFVQIISIGDFSVTYRISGLLEEVKSLISARSRLMANVLDTLHNDDIEIMSPNFMVQRRQEETERMIPHVKPTGPRKRKKATVEAPEAVMFDKADEAEANAKRIDELQKEIKALKSQHDAASGEERKALDEQLDVLAQKLAELEADKGDKLDEQN